MARTNYRKQIASTLIRAALAQLETAHAEEIDKIRAQLKSVKRKHRDAEDWIRALNEINHQKPSKKSV